MKKTILLFAFALITISSISQNFDNEFYFRFGYSNPSWNQFGLNQDEWKDMGFENKIGGIFELGSIFMINSLPAAENMALGINVDYLYMIYNSFSTNNSYDEAFANARVGSKIGPSFTYSPVNKLAFDIYAKADIAWAAAAVWYEGSIGDADDYYRGKVALGFSTGLNIRYGILMLGFEFDTNSPKLESDDYPGEYIGNNNDDSNKSPLPCMNFTLGLSF